MKPKITLEEYNKIVEELKYRKGPLAEEIIEEIKRTVNPSDHFPNDNPIKRQNANERKIKRLEEYLARSEIVESKKNQGIVEIGSTIKIQIDNNSEKTIKLISSENIDFEMELGCITEKSPVGSAILGKKVGENAEVKLANKSVSVTILSIE